MRRCRRRGSLGRGLRVGWSTDVVASEVSRAGHAAAGQADRGGAPGEAPRPGRPRRGPRRRGTRRAARRRRRRCCGAGHRAVAVTTPSSSTRTAPSAPRLARTVPAPQRPQSPAASTTSPSHARAGRTTSASSSRLGLTRVGPGQRGRAGRGRWCRRRRGSPRRAAGGRAGRRRRRAAPGGTLPHSDHPVRLPVAASGRRRRSRRTRPRNRAGPGSLTLVTVPSGSARVTLDRVRPAIGTAITSTPSAWSRRTSWPPSSPPTREDRHASGPRWPAARGRR